MKTKHLLMTLLLALLVPWAAQAQLTMTVCEGEVTNLAIPLNGYSTDTQGSCGEFIIPASQLSGMIGSEISQISFYPQAGYSWSATFQVYVKEVTETSLNSTLGPNACTVVYTGSLNASGTTMDIPFDDNYVYEGGNLLIGTYISVAGNYVDHAYFYGIEAEGAAYASGTYSGSYNGSYNFIPKTTFTYFPADFCYEPANVHIVENTLGPREVAIEWDAESGELFEESMQATSSFDPNNIHWSGASTSHFEEWDRLTPDTDYTFCVRKKCGTDSYSQPVFLEFRTTVACPAPTLALVANSETARGATLSWTGFSESYILQMGSFVSSQTQTILSEGFEGGSMPTGWTSEGTTSWTVGTGDYSSSTTHTGSYNAKPSSSSSGSGNTGYLVTPVMNLNSYSNAKLSCWYMNHSWGGDTDAFGVYYRTSSTGTWNELFSTNSAHTSWTQTDELSLPSEAYVQIGFKYTDNYGYGVAVDDIEITADVVTYEWITFDNNATSPYTFTTLLPETTYNVRVIGNCGSDGQSQPSNMVSFTTLASCPVPTALNVPETTITAHEATLLWTADNDSYNIRYQISNSIFEGFEGGTLPTGWTVTSTGSNNWAVATSVISGVAPHGGSYAIGTPQGTSSRSEEMYLISPSMDLSTATSATLHFYYYQKAWGSDTDPFGVYYRVNGGSWQELFYSTTSTSAWTEKTIELQGLAANYQIGFYRKDNYAYGNAIDDIEISIVDPTASWLTATSNTTSYHFTGLDPETKYNVQVQGVCGSETTNWSEAISFTTLIACPAPTNLTKQTPGAFSAVLSWNETGGANAWQLCLNDATPYLDIDETDVTINGNNVTYTLGSLTPDTYYTVKVRANCGGIDGESQWSNLVSFTTAIACPAPANLFGDYITKNSVVLTWGETGEATAWQIMLNNDESHLIEVTEANSTNNDGVISFTLEGLTPQTDYSVRVRANCGGDDGVSRWCDDVFDFTTTVVCPAPTNLTISSNPTYNSVGLTWTETGEATEWEICVNGDTENLIGVTENPYTLNRLDPETDYTVKVRAVCGGDDGESQWSNTVSFTTLVACPAPTNLAANNITQTSATLSWEGSSNSYDLQYRPWAQVGEDQIATAVLTTYTYNLSEYSGTGAIAIRHYDVSDMFQLNIDDVVVTDVLGEVIYSENFENDNGNLPSNFSYIDLDGDGYVWSIRSNGTDGQGNPYCNGNYCASSASWISGVGAIHPDNWMIISGVELGGTLTFVARGQDPEWAAENFAVYVSANANLKEVPSIEGTTYLLDNLEPDSPYSWQVIGDCGDLGNSRVASSMFKTQSNLLVFNKNGNWNKLANWVDAEGNPATALPTIDNKVLVDSTAVIPSGVLAIAGKTTLGSEGAIIIKDGGQLKQSSATLKVTMEKEITGIGLDNWNDENYHGGWTFISSPFSGRTLYDETSDWNHVINLLSDDYDLYAFDPTQTLEWINYQANPTHISFQSENNNAGLYYGEGYLYASQEDRTLQFVGSTGKSNNYSEIKDYTFSGESTDDWNGWALVGNFFSCNAYINYVDANGDVLNADFYTLNNAGDGYELSESSVGLPPCTGAFINYSATGKVQYATEAPAGDRTGMLNMTLNQGRGNIDQARLRFGRGYNLKHMSFRNNSSKLYMPVEGNDYAVVYAEGNGEMPVNFKAERNGTYTLGFNTENVEFSYLHLIDNLTGNDVDLLANSSYSFEAQTTDYASRFKLVFASGSNDDNFAFFNNGNIIVNNEGEATLQVMDVNGRIIRSESINGTASIKMNASAGVYMLRLINGNDVKVQKMIVK